MLARNRETNIHCCNVTEVYVKCAILFDGKSHQVKIDAINPKGNYTYVCMYQME